MRNIRFVSRRISIWIILFLQIILITTYFFLQTENPLTELDTNVSFIPINNIPKHLKITYHTMNSQITLKTTSSSNLYIDFNISICYKTGSNLDLMKRSKSLNWECKCLSDWHGKDCAQPEVIWRALLSTRFPLLLKGPRKYLRRIIYIFEVNEFTEAITEIRINELNSLIDLFVLYEIRENGQFEQKLKKGFLKDFHNKILYLQFSELDDVWLKVKSNIVNLNNEDIILIGGLTDVPNGLALQYFKLYDKWSQPLLFRLRWSVYGYFWLHPSKTLLNPGACTVSYLLENLSNNIKLLSKQNTSNLGKTLIIGDLNHFGGWQCEYCYESHDILKAFDNLLLKGQIQFNDIKKLKIDNTYIEDLIENGVYIDGTTALLRTHRNQDHYFAPPYVQENSWKYDWLLINLYSKMDYY